jgi:hypothetical protein
MGVGIFFETTQETDFPEIPTMSSQMSQKRENQGALGSFFLTTVCQKFLCMPN